VERQAKETMVASLTETFKTAQVGFLLDFRGMNVAQATELRRKLRAAKAGMRVVKNNLAKIALKGTPFEGLEPSLVDTRALVFGADPVGPAKVLTQFLKDHEKIKYIAGLLVKGELGQLVDERMAKALAELPSREQLIAQLLGLLAAPAGKLVRTLNEVPASFVRTLKAIAEQKAKAEPTAQPAAS
jgi:large subunit ribosomal protein L10